MRSHNQSIVRIQQDYRTDGNWRTNRFRLESLIRANAKNLNRGGIFYFIVDPPARSEGKLVRNYIS